MSYRKLTIHPLQSFLRGAFARTAAGALGAAAPLAVLANPTGGQVVGGTATIGSAGANGVVVTQGSQRAIINWQQFSVGSGQYVQFVQPNSSSVVLNRVTGNNPSNIFGDIIANGQVFLVNSNGVYFAPGASIDVQGLVASTLDLNDADFMQGRYVFSKVAGVADAGVVNAGSIRAGTGGYVVLAGDYANNSGAIVAQTGRVYLAAGNAATLTLDNNSLISYTVDGKTLSRLAGVSNTGDIAANGGLVVMTADVANTLTATAVNNSGLITAHSVRNEGGEIVLAAKGGDIENSGTLDASANVSGMTGGTVILHGDGNTRLTDTSVIDTEGDGARGGFVDVSGHELTLKGTFNVGQGGQLVLDPSIIRIEGAFSGSNSANCSDCEGGVIHTPFIQHELNLGVDLTIVASNQIKLSSGAHGAPLPTAITATTGSGKLSLRIGHTSGTIGGSLNRITSSIFTGGSQEHFVPGTGGTIDLTGLTINIKGGFLASASHGQVTLGKVTAGNVTVTGGQITTGALKATTGSILVKTTGFGGGSISINGAVSAAGPFAASAGSASGNGNIKISGGVTAQNISLKTAGTSRGNISVHALHATGTVSSGSITIHASETTPAFSGGNVNIQGAVTADHAGVTITAAGGGDSSGGNITVTGAIHSARQASISAHYIGSSTGDGGGRVKLGNVTGQTVTITTLSSQPSISVGSITATKQNDGSDVVQIIATHAGGGTLAPRIKVNGAITAAEGVFISAAGTNPLVSVGAITANSQGCPIADCSTPTVSIQAHTGTINVTGAIVVDQDAFKAPDVNLSGRVIKFGSITAPGSVNISADTTSSINHAGITQATGTTLKARFINVDLNASYGGAVTLANLTASSSKGSAGVDIQALSHNAANSVTVTGNITVSGKGAGNISGSLFQNHGINSAMPHGGAPVAAFLDITASGSTGAAHTVKVGGAITLTGHAGHFSGSHILSSCGECAVQYHGTGGSANAQITATGSHGSVQLLGTTTLKGTDAQLQVGAKTIKTGALNVAGTGHTFHAHASGSVNQTFSSTNNAGVAAVTLQNSSGNAATTIVTGNVTVSGKGSASLQMQGVSITAGNISVTASKATGTRVLHGFGASVMSHYGLGSTPPGMFNFRMDNGSFSAGRAGVFLGASNGSPTRPGTPAQRVTAGSITVTGVGEADIEVGGNTIVTGALSANAAAGLEKGSFASGGITTNFNVNGGEADIELKTGTATGTTITVNGGVNASGPVASVNLSGRTIKVTKGISVTGKGGKVAVTGSGAGFSSSVTAPGPITGISLGGSASSNAASINVGGTVSAKGPGMIGIAVMGTKVTLGGLSASASNVAAYKLKNTSAGINDTFTAGSVAVLVFDTSSAGGPAGAAKINGNVNITAQGNVALGAQLDATGTVTVSGKAIDTNVGTVITRIQEISNLTGHGGSGGPNIPSSGALAPKIAAAGISMTATGGSIDLTSAALTTPTAGALTLKATKDIILSGVTINVGTFAATAGGTIHNGGATGTITANGLALTAGKNINLSSTQITVGNGSVASLASDPLLLEALAAAGLSPNSPKPNAYFNAGGTLTLGKLTLTGTWLYMQGSNITLLGPVSTPANSVVQFAPTTGTATVGVEQNPGTGSVLNLSNSLLLSLFPGTTLVLGNGAQTGAMTLGNNGTIDIGSSNLIIDTTGTVTGLNNVISTGLVSTVESLLASALAPPTPDEIDPNSSNNNNTAGKHHQEGDYDPNAGTTGGGTVSQSTDTGGACH